MPAEAVLRYNAAIAPSDPYPLRPAPQWHHAECPQMPLCGEEGAGLMLKNWCQYSRDPFTSSFAFGNRIAV